MKFLFLASLFLLFNFIHGGHIAEYFFSVENETLNLKFVIDKDELLLFDITDQCDMVNMTALCTSKYLKNNMSILINGEPIVFELQDSYTENHHLIIKLSSLLCSKKIMQITIENNCFYDFDHDFKNRIILDIGKFNSSYLLNLKHNRIELD